MAEEKQEQQAITYDPENAYDVKDSVSCGDLAIYKDFGLLENSDDDKDTVNLMIKNTVFEILPNPDKAMKIFEATVSEKEQEKVDGADDIDAMKLRGAIISFLAQYLLLSKK